MDKKITWISAYPKSGRTWLKILIESILFSNGEILSINNLKIIKSSNIGRYKFDEIFGVKSSDLTLEETWEFKRKYYLNEFNTKNEFILTHDENLIMTNGKRFFPEEITESVIHIVRNPLAIVPSLANHFRVSINESIQILASPNIHTGKEIYPSTSDVYAKSGSWSSHVHSWVNDSPYPIYLVRYEDLVENPLPILNDLFQFLGQEIEESIIQKAIDNSTFQKLSNAEEIDGFREKPSTSAKFFRKGKVNAWKEELTLEQENRVINNHEEMMIQMGYL